jgi:hypothetical protein
MRGTTYQMSEKTAAAAADADADATSTLENNARKDAPPALSKTELPTALQDICVIERPEKAVLRPTQFICSSIYLSSPSELSINSCCALRAHVTPVAAGKMHLSKSNKIIILLVIDSIFFLLELVVGQ